MYKIVRIYTEKRTRHTLYTDLTLEQVQDHCRDPETSSRTCTSAAANRITRRNGEWFDGYEET